MPGPRLAIVTGAGGALGSAVVDALLAAGLNVVGVARGGAALAGLPEQVHRETADVTDREAAGALLDRVAQRLGAPDVLVNTVGGFAPGDALGTTPDALAAMLGVNLNAAWWLSQAAARHMQPRGRGALVHVAARNGIEPVPGAAAYGVSKAALIQLVRVLDAELGPHGIRVNAVVPRLIDTPANRVALPPGALARAVSPAAIAKVIAFLAGDDAAPVSGAVLPVYGGG